MIRRIKTRLLFLFFEYVCFILSGVASEAIILDEEGQMVFFFSMVEKRRAVEAVETEEPVHYVVKLFTKKHGDAKKVIINIKEVLTVEIRMNYAYADRFSKQSV